MLAACQGKGKLNDALSLHTTAQADGSFVLAGLTPGAYQVQAAMDGIWLSESIALAVGKQPRKPLVLDVAPPGAAALVKLVDGRGEPVRDAEVAIARPAGPLRARLWPKILRSDGAGQLLLEGLEAGTHTLTIKHTGNPHQIRLPAAPAPPSATRIVVEDGGNRP